MKIVGIVGLVLVLGIAGIFYYLSRGLDEMADITVNEVPVSGLSDGVYRGVFEGYRWSNEVEVKIEDGRMVEIVVVKPHRFYRSEVADELIRSVLNEQSAAVDGVAGATVSSIALQKSIEHALLSAIGQ